MRLLLDTHALIWAVDDPIELGKQAAVALQDSKNELLISAGTTWELSIKISLSKLTLSLPFLQWMTTAVDDLSTQISPITFEHADKHSSLPYHHRDPFDRLLAAQAQVEELSLVSGDLIFDQYEISRLWE